MSVSHIKEPASDGNSVYLPLIHHTRSTTTVDKLVYDVYYSDGTYLLFLCRKKVVPLPNTNDGIIDLSKTIQSLFTDYFKPSADLVSFTTNDFAHVYAVNYGSEVGGVVTMPSPPVLGGGHEFRVYNCYPNSIFNDNYIYEQLTSPVSMLSNRYVRELQDNNYNLKATKYTPFLLPFVNPYFGDISKNDWTLNITIWQGSTMLDFFDYTFETDKQLIQINFSHQTIKEAYDDLKGAVDISEYDNINFRLVNDVTNDKTEWFNIDYECSKDNAYNVTFLNQFGGYESYTFNSVNRLQQTVERKQFKQTGIVIPSGTNISDKYRFSLIDKGSYGGYMAMRNRQETPFYTKQDYVIKLQSGWLNEDQYKWMKELLSSKDVWVNEAYKGQDTSLYYDYNNLFPGQVKTAEWLQKLDGVDKMFNLEVEINLGSIIC